MKLAALAVASAYTVSDTTMERYYLNYIAEQGKSYATVEEYILRLNYFTKKMELLQEYNSKNSEEDVKLAFNHMSDWTDFEYKSILGYKKSVDTEEKQEADLPR
jgi:hypothetical protein